MTSDGSNGRPSLARLTEREQQVLALDAEAEVLNCAVTSYRYDPDAGRLVLERYNEAAPLEEQDAPVTSEPDATGAPR